MMSEPIEPIAADAARARLEQAIREHLGDDWQDETGGWLRVTGHDYMARYTRGRVNVDFYVDLLGNVTVETSEITPAQDSGRLVALVLLLASVGLAVMLARVAGWL